MSTLMQASNQWATRPADERFASVEDLHHAVTHHREMSVEAADVDVRSLAVQSLPNADGIAEPAIVGTTGQPARFTNFSFGQFARRVSAPASYLRALPPDLVAANLNHGIRNLPATVGEHDNMLFAQNGGLRLRAMVSERYTRIWNADITLRLMRLMREHPEWQPAPAAYDGSRGLYASDHDMFAFMVDNNRRIFEQDPNGGFSRGFFLSNSEVGASSFAIMTFLYQYVCGNHIVWGAKGVSEIRIPHIGDADDKAFRRITVELRQYAADAASTDEARLMAAKKLVLGTDRESVLDAVFAKRLPNVSRALLGKAYDHAEAHEDWYGAPNTVFGMVSGMTGVAREIVHADKRTEIDRAAGKLMQIAF